MADFSGRPKPCGRTAPPRAVVGMPIPRRWLVLVLSVVSAVSAGGCGPSRAPGLDDAGTSDAGGPEAPGADADADAASEATDATSVVQRGPLWKLLLPAATYETRVQAATSTDIEAVAASYGADGYVITAALATEAQSTSYELFGEREIAATATFDTRVVLASFADLDAKATALAADGFALTAVTKTFAGLTLFGVRPTGDARTYVSKTLLVTGPSLDPAVFSLGSEGFVVTAMSWSGTGYRLFGVREAGSTAVLDAKVIELDGSDFSTMVTAEAARGYVVTSAIANSSTYVLAVARPAGTATPRAIRVKGAIGAQLEGEAAAFGAAGMIIQTVAAAESVFTLFGSSAD